MSLIVLLLLYLTQIQAWLPDTSTKLKNPIELPQETFKGNFSHSDHFAILYQDEDTLLLGGRNRVYNLSINNNAFSERRRSGIFWPSSEAHSQLCFLKGKSDDECQNYIRLLFRVGPGKLLACGTNSFKPLCATFVWKDGVYQIQPNAKDAKGLCPFDPDHNSTAIYSDGQLFSATVADFAGGDPLIFRDPQPLATELADLKHLNAPNFVSSMAFGDYIYFFFRETAVEFMNCGKIIYSRVARVCKHDKGGGSHLSRNKWTTFSKARLNCSVPGEYPFYFDEIQSTSQIIDGTYGESRTKLIYAALTTPDNAIGGSAICLFRMSDVQNVFDGPFKHQETINSNWLPVPPSQVPEPRPGRCVNDSRLLPDATVNFIKQHPLMEDAVPAHMGRPILIRVSLNYRFTAVVVDAQVRTVNDRTFDVVYVGTDDGKVLKIVNVATETTPKAVVISDNDVFPKGTPVTQLALGQGYGGVVVVGKNETKLVVLNHCKQIGTCSECVELRDPHCAWDQIKNVCVSVDSVTNFRYLVQDVAKGSAAKCRSTEEPGVKKVEYISSNSIDDDDDDDDDSDANLNELLIQSDDEQDCSEKNDGEYSTACLKIKKSEFTSGTLWWGIIVAAMVGLLIGFVGGYCVSKKLYMNFPNTSCIEQRNHIDRLNVNQNSFLPRPKNVNLDVLQMTQEALPPKKDNLGSLKNLNINEGTLQKIKKTYI